jgi:DNA-binding CsgD family transcriptional regulator
MARLRHQELRALSEALLNVYSPGSYADFPASVSETLRRCLSFDSLAYHEIIDNQNQRALIIPEVPFDGAAFETYVHQHPTWNAFVRDRLEIPLRISDFVNRDELERTDLYNYIFRPLAIRYQLGFITLNDVPQLGIGLNRFRVDFSEEERTILNLLKPHLFQAFTTSKLFSYFRDASDAGDYGYVVADAKGRIRFCTSKAVAWLQEYFGHRQSTSLPHQLGDWLKNRSFKLFNPDNLAVLLKEFSIQRGPKRLTVRSLSSVQAAEHRLVLTETSEELDANLLQTLGLTKREAEVLFWVSQGKRNCEIAEILGARSRTIGKHVERILGKLCVETRTAAANIAAEVLR